MGGAHCSRDSGKSVLLITCWKQEPSLVKPQLGHGALAALSSPGVHLHGAQLHAPALLLLVNAGATLDLEAFPPTVPTISLHPGKDSDEGCGETVTVRRGPL